MIGDFLTSPRAVGVLLVASTAAYVLGFVVLAIQGRIGGMASTFRGVEGIGEAAVAQRLIEPFLRVGMLLVVAGFALLSAHLSDQGERFLGTVAIPLLVIGSFAMVIEGSFHGSVTAWAGERWAESGELPVLYEQLRLWLNTSLQVAALMFTFAATLCYGWGLLNTGIGPPWIGWATVGWSGLWLGLLIIGIPSLPAVILVIPTLVGIGLLVAPG